MSEPAPTPAAVANLKARHMPADVREAVTDWADAVRELHTPTVGAAREDALSRIARANKALAQVPHRHG